MKHKLVLVVFVLALVAGAGVEAQRRARLSTVKWSVFTGPYRSATANKTELGVEAGSVVLPPELKWTCDTSVAERKTVSATNWSEVRAVTCKHGEAVVSVTGTCQVAGRRWYASKGSINLSNFKVGEASAVLELVLNCSVE